MKDKFVVTLEGDSIVVQCASCLTGINGRLTQKIIESETHDELKTPGYFTVIEKVKPFKGESQNKRYVENLSGILNRFTIAEAELFLGMFYEVDPLKSAMTSRVRLKYACMTYINECRNNQSEASGPSPTWNDVMHSKVLFAAYIKVLYLFDNSTTMKSETDVVFGINVFIRNLMNFGESSITMCMSHAAFYVYILNQVYYRIGDAPVGKDLLELIEADMYIGYMDVDIRLINTLDSLIKSSIQSSVRYALKGIERVNPEKILEGKYAYNHERNTRQMLPSNL